MTRIRVLLCAFAAWIVAESAYAQHVVRGVACETEELAADFARQYARGLKVDDALKKVRSKDSREPCFGEGITVTISREALFKSEVRRVRVRDIEMRILAVTATHHWIGKLDYRYPAPHKLFMPYDPRVPNTAADSRD